VADLVSVVWDGLDLMPGEDESGFLAIVTNVEGWYGSPPIDGHDLERALTDGALWGPKIIHARAVTITGTGYGTREGCVQFSREIEQRAWSRVPETLAIGDWTHQVGGDLLVLTADVRAGTDQLTHAWHGPIRFDYQVVLLAADPRLYGQDWRSETLTVLPPGGTGRRYWEHPGSPPSGQVGREYPWQYGAGVLPNSAQLVNDGNEAAPVEILYTGDLSETRLQPQGYEGLIRVAPLLAGEQILIDSSSLAAIARGGATRANYVLPGSVPLLIPPRSSVRWSLYGTGYGSVQLRWRDTYA
jgi:hypothetical protein